MSEAFEIRTARLRLRSWREDDFEAYAALNADPRVMEFYPSLVAREESRQRFEGWCLRTAERGYGYWPVDLIGGPRFIGLVGLADPDFEAPFMPAVEIGWRVAADHWGRGYATEAARGALAFGFERLGLQEIVAFTTSANTRSRRVMEKLGMKRLAEEDFQHPLIAEGHPLRPHVLYRLRRGDFAPGT